MAKDIKSVMIAIAKEMNLKFSYKSVPISSEDVFSDIGLMPAIATRADQLCQLCFGYGIGMQTEKTDAAKLGKKVIFDDVTPDTLRYLCLLDVLTELRNLSTVGDTVTLDELEYE
jgi:intracellular multiplication protein IcmS